MPTFEVDISQLGALFQQNEKARVEAVRKGIYEAALAGLGVIVPAAPKDTGHLRQSAHVESDIVTQTIAIVLDAPYAALIELGTRPHMAPIQPLIDWVHRHATLLGAADEAAEKSIAYAIRQKIAVEGSEPTFFVRESIPKLQALLVQIVTERLVRA